VLPGVFRVGTAAGAAVGAATLAAGCLWHDRGGPHPEAATTLVEAAVAFRSERYLRVEGAPAHDVWAPLSGDYRTADDGWVRLHCNFDHHRDAVLRALAVEDDRGAVEAAVAAVPAVEVEERVLAEGGAAGALRSAAAWAEHPQGRHLAALPVVGLRPIATSSATGRPEPVPATAPARPLEGVRVLDLTRVIAGPVCARTLAAHGAEVLRVGSEHLPEVEPLLVDTGFGKRSCHLDLRTDDGREALRRLVAEADVVVQSYRPGALERIGFGAEDLAAIRPGLVCVNLSAYGPGGPWWDRRGFDSVVQLVTGLADDARRLAGTDQPVPLPAQALDHGAGWLAAFGAVMALRRQRRDGGSWVVDVSLAGIAGWLRGLGRLDRLDAPEPDRAEAKRLREVVDTPWGAVSHLRPPGRLTGADPHWVRPSPRPGSSECRWMTAGNGRHPPALR
jgi:hypothetical protein